MSQLQTVMLENLVVTVVMLFASALLLYLGNRSDS